MQRCAVCEVRLPTEPEDDCDGEMEVCHRVCPRVHMEEYKDGLFFCTSCYLWLLGTYNDILAGRPFDTRAVRFLRLMTVDQAPLLTDWVRTAVKRGGRSPPLPRRHSSSARQVSA
ncbi:MAG TPA: hypothetical protein VEY12_00620 [Thermoplasmata archaeon]|nr:hypothetical protein [Thermoplasmata archaeon]